MTWFKTAIALGSNLGNSQQILEAAIHQLNQHPEIKVLAHSAWYETLAIGPPQPNYLNGCAILETTFSPQALLTYLLTLEQQFGRLRRELWGPRTLDLDLLLYDQWQLTSPQLTIPHPRLTERAFVLIPLAAIAPDWIEPVSQKTILALAKNSDPSGILSIMTFPTEPDLVLRQRLQYQGRKFDFEVSQRRLPNGVEGEWECIRHPGGALAVPITPEGQLVLVKQYRFAVQGRLLEFPAGTVEPTEDPAETIKRELEEETGYRAHQWRSLGKFALAPGYSDEYIYAYLAEGLEKLAQPPQQDEDEDIEVVLMTFDEFEQAVKEGQLIDAKTISSYFLMLKQTQR